MSASKYLNPLTGITVAMFLLLPTVQVMSQNSNREIQIAVETLFTGVRKGDSSLVRGTFLAGAFMSSFSNNARDSLILRQENSIAGFLKAVGTPHKEVWDERIYDLKILTDGPMAVVWAPYKFYFGEKFSHCGVNVFTLLKTPAGWKISEIADTRRKDNCQ